MSDNRLVGTDKKNNLATRRIELDFDDITALAATPIELVPAPGAGQSLELVGAILKLEAGTEVLTESADNLEIKYTNAAGVSVTGAIEMTGFIDQAVDTQTSALPILDAIVASSAAENKALVLDNSGDGEIAGNASEDAKLVLMVTYRTHDFDEVIA